MTLESQRVRRAALFWPNARCESCRVSDPIVLIPDATMLLCADCDAIRHGRLPEEVHHIAGKRNGPWVVILSSNMHRRLSARQHSWLAKTSRAPSTIRSRAALLRGFGDLCHEVAESLEAEGGA